jgi:hypothetical protein
MEAVDGETVTVVGAGGTAVTVMLELPVMVDDMAEIVAEPAPTPVTTPLPFTDAIAELLDDQVTVCPVITLPF